MHRNALTAIELGFCVVIVIVVMAIVGLPVPASFTLDLFPRVRGGHSMPVCQSNLTQIGRAFKMYMSDWDNTFPTNRNWLGSGKLGSVTEHVKLSLHTKNAAGQVCKFKYGINWVESLDGYLNKDFNKDIDTAAVWRCSLASERNYKAESATAATSYVFNRNLAEKQEDIVKYASNLMMVREMDRLVDAELRPVNDSTVSFTSLPKSPFLTNEDVRLGKTEADIHGHGSYILFEDGHVSYSNSSDMPDSPSYNAATQQWCNLCDGRIIAITP